MNVGRCLCRLQYINLYFIEMHILRPRDVSEGASGERLPLGDSHRTDGKSPLVQKTTDLMYCIIDVQCNPAPREVVKEQPRGDEHKLLQVFYACANVRYTAMQPLPPADDDRRERSEAAINLSVQSPRRGGKSPLRTTGHYLMHCVMRLSSV